MGVVSWEGDGGSLPSDGGSLPSGRLKKNISGISFYTGFENSTIVQDTDKMILRFPFTTQ